LLTEELLVLHLLHFAVNRLLNHELFLNDSSHRHVRCKSDFEYFVISILNTSAAFVPAMESSNIMIPSWLAPKTQLIFGTNHSVTFLSTNFPFFVKATPVASYNTAYCCYWYFCPASTLAPHTICTGTPSPKSTVVILVCRHLRNKYMSYYYSF
jgi:hypothetical protein